MPFTADWLEVNFGGAYAGLGTVGYRLVNNAGGDSVARTTTGVVDLGGGDYGAAAITIPDDAISIQWDTGGGSPVYASEDLAKYRIAADVWEVAAADHLTAGSFGLWSNFMRYRGAVWIDTNGSNTNTVTGTDGTPENPVSTHAAAMTIAGNIGSRSLVLMNGSFLQLTAYVGNFHIRSVGFSSGVDLNSQDVSGAYFEDCVITGSQGFGAGLQATNCTIYYHSNAVAIYRGCFFGLDLTLADSNQCFFDQCFFGTPATAVDINYTGAGAFECMFTNCGGHLRARNMTQYSRLDYQGAGALVIHTDCTSGIVKVRGPVAVTDNGTTTVLELDTDLTRSGIDAELSATHGAGAWTGSTPALVADAVWDELKAGHTIAGSFGQILAPPFKYVSIETEITTRTIETEIRPPIQIDTEIDCR